MASGDFLAEVGQFPVQRAVGRTQGERDRENRVRRWVGQHAEQPTRATRIGVALSKVDLSRALRPPTGLPRVRTGGIQVSLLPAASSGYA
jgi:hypothetical protein